MSRSKEGYAIKEAAERSGISEDTIRYYERIGLLPPAERKENTHRLYRDEHIETMKLIGCLKKTGMPLEEMKPFLHVSLDRDPSEYPELFALMATHKRKIEAQIEELREVLHFMESKMSVVALADHTCTAEEHAKLDDIHKRRAKRKPAARLTEK